MGKVIIYSNHRIEGLRGQYIAPYYFKEEQIEGAEKVYTVKEDIEKICKAKKIPVEFIGKRKSVAKKDK